MLLYGLVYVVYSVLLCYGVSWICGLVYILFYGVFFSSCVMFERRMEGGSMEQLHKNL